MVADALSRALERIRLIAAVRHRTELRRRRDHPQLLAAVILGAAFGTLLIVGSLPVRGLEMLWPEPGAYYYGTVAATEQTLVLELTRELAAIGIIATGALGALGATTSDDWEQPPVEIVTAVSMPTAIVGVLCDELLESSWFAAPVVAGGAVAFTIGTGDPRALLGTAVGGGTLLVTGLLTGTALGVLIRASIRRSPRLYAARYGVSVLVLFVTFMGLAVSRTLGTALASTPLGWYGDLLLLSTPGIEAVPRQALLAVLLSMTVVPLALGAVIVAGRSLWFAETVLDDGTVTDTGRGRLGTVLDTTLERAFGRPTVAAMRSVWVRMRRSPRAMVYVVLPVAFVGPVTIEVASSAPAMLPPLLVLYAACAVGLGTTLNPLGNERAALSLIRTTPGGPTTVLRGHVLAALVPGLPAVAVVASAVALGVGYPLWSAIAFVLSALAVTAGGGALSLAVGSYLPNLEGPTDSSLAPPELYAMFGYLFVMGLLAGPMGVGFATTIGFTPAGALGTLLATVALTGYVGRRSVRYAGGRLETFESGRAQ